MHKPTLPPIVSVEIIDGRPAESALSAGRFHILAKRQPDRRS
jgi:hypothetical protein